MGVQEILIQIDQEISQLEKARTLLREMNLTSFSLDNTNTMERVVRKRNLSPEGRQRIAEAVKRRWARQKGSPASLPVAS